MLPIMIATVVLIVFALVVAAASRRRKDAIYLQYKSAMKKALDTATDAEARPGDVRMVA